MTQEEIDTLYSITIMIHENEWFGTNKPRRDREEVQAWVADQLAKSSAIYTIPIGSGWGTLVSKERFDSYWRERAEREIIAAETKAEELLVKTKIRKINLVLKILKFLKIK